MADVAAYLENHGAQESQEEAYESHDELPQTTTMTKRLRSPSLGSATDGTGAADQELSPRKLARLASGSRFDQGIDQNEAQSAHERERQHGFENALSAAPVGESNDQAAQRALSVLRDAEALVPQRVAEHDNAGTGAATPHATPGTTAAAAAAASTLAEAASNQLAATNAANAASAAAAVAAIAAAAAATQTRRESDGTAAHDAQPGSSMLRFPDESTTTMSSNAADALPASATPLEMPELTPRGQAGSKRHKCPDCDTEFTRHHNLKSHLLTHSQEKPYACRGCDMSFRRLHDLKRHSKLHTGEKPHICPRCDRKFARGDALARHSKGAGGCAGRRSGSGIFPGDQSFEGNSSLVDDSMSGMEFGNTDDLGRRKLSLPSMKAQLDRTLPSQARVYSPNPPPAAAAAAAASAAAAAAAAAAEGQRGTNASGSGLYPLNTERIPDAASAALSSLATSTLAASNAIQHAAADASITGSGGTILSQQGIVESPKTASANAGRPELGQAQAQGQQALARPTENSNNSDTNANIFSSEQGMWAYIQTLEDKLKVQADRLREQDEHIAQLEVARQNAEAQVETFKQRIDTLLGPSGAASPSGDPALATTTN